MKIKISQRVGDMERSIEADIPEFYYGSEEIERNEMARHVSLLSEALKQIPFSDK